MIYSKSKVFYKISQIPKFLVMTLALVCCCGFVILWSASGGSMSPWVYKQIINFMIFLPIAILIAMADLRSILNFSYLLYLVVLILLIAVELFGTSAMGAKRWIDLGLLKIQPSEPAKIAIILMLARYFHELKLRHVREFIRLIIPIIGAAVPITLIIKQPDLGTGIITLIIVAVIFFAAGVLVWKFVFCGFFFLVSLPIVWQMMHDYQRKRVLIFLDPQQDPLGAGYNIIQSKIAIGSGGLVGKGLGHGTQSQLSFLPEPQTDFIFACMAEEFGLTGSIALLLLYTILIVISLSVAVTCKSVFGRLVVIGISTMFFAHVFINIAMVIGMVPVVGVPLPFISYGGTMMASMLIGFGLVMNVHINKHYKM